MKTVLIITLVAALVVTAGCGASRKNRSAKAESVPAATEGDQTGQEQLPEVAPFGNAALAGKPEQAAEDTEAAAHVWDFRDATTWLLGDINPILFYNQPHSEWYHDGYGHYRPEMEILADLMKLNTENLTITIVLGTWCPDSRREVPRFMKIIDLWGFPKEKIRFIGVDINKIAPLEDYAQLAIERVPTFIFYENNIEKGRIIEVPVTSLEQDTKTILTGN